MLEYSLRSTNKDFSGRWKAYLKNSFNVSDFLDNKIDKSDIEKKFEENCTSDTSNQVRLNYTSILCGTFSKGIEYLTKSYSLQNEDLYWKDSLKFDAALFANIIASDMDFITEQLKLEDNNIELLKSAFMEYYSLSESDNKAASTLEKLHVIEKLNPDNYFIQYKIGMIYFFSPSCLNLDKAELFFKKSIHNSMSRHSSLAIQLTKHTLPSSIDIKNINDLVRYHTAETYYRFSILNYVKGELDKAFKNALKVSTINPEHKNSLYLQAKILAAQNKISETQDILSQLSESTPIYSVKTAFDFDFCINNKLAEYFNEMSKIQYSMLLNLLGLLKKKSVPHSVTSDFIKGIENDLNSDSSFLSSSIAIKSVKVKRFWEISNYVIDTTAKPILLKGHTSPVSTLDFHPYLQILVSGSWDSSIIEWDLQKLKQRKQYRGFRGEVTQAVYSNSGKYIVAVTNMGHAKLIDSSESEELKDWDFGKCIISSVCFSNDDSIIYLGCSDKQIRVIDRYNDSVSNIKTADEVTSLIHLNKSEIIIWGESSGQIHSHNFENNVRQSYNDHKGSITAICISGDDKKIVSSGEDKLIVIRNLDEAESQTKKIKINIRIHELDFSPNNTLFAAACSDNFTRLYNLEGRETGTYSGHKISVESVKFQMNGNVLSTAGYDKNVKLWGKFIVTRTFNESLRDIVSIEIKNEKNLKAFTDNNQRLSEKAIECRIIEGRESYLQAREEEKKQNKRFGSKDYGKALKLYRKAFESGIKEAHEKILELERK